MHHHTAPSLGKCRVARWFGGLSMLGTEATAKRRGVDSHRTAVEHNLRAGKGTVQIDHPRFEQADEWKPS